MLAVKVLPFSPLYSNAMTHYDENPVGFKYHATMSLKMTAIKPMKYSN